MHRDASFTRPRPVGRLRMRGSVSPACIALMSRSGKSVSSVSKRGCGVVPARPAPAAIQTIQNAAAGDTELKHRDVRTGPTERWPEASHGPVPTLLPRSSSGPGARELGRGGAGRGRGGSRHLGVRVPPQGHQLDRRGPGVDRAHADPIPGSAARLDPRCLRSPGAAGPEFGQGRGDRIPAPSPRSRGRVSALSVQIGSSSAKAGIRATALPLAPGPPLSRG